MTLGLVTFDNPSNLCYLNTALQTLIHIRPLTKYFLKKYPNKNQIIKNRDKYDIVLRNYIVLLQVYWEDDGTCLEPHSFRELFE